MAKTKHNDDGNAGNKKPRTFRVLFTNGKELMIRADRFEPSAEDHQVRFYDEHGASLRDTFIARAEVAAIVPE